MDSLLLYSKQARSTTKKEVATVSPVLMLPCESQSNSWIKIYRYNTGEDSATTMIILHLKFILKQFFCGSEKIQVYVAYNTMDD